MIHGTAHPRISCRREALEGNPAAIGEVGIQVEAVEQGGAEKGALSNGENRDVQLCDVSDDGRPMNGRRYQTAIGQIGV